MDHVHLRQVALTRLGVEHAGLERRHHGRDGNDGDQQVEPPERLDDGQHRPRQMKRRHVEREVLNAEPFHLFCHPVGLLAGVVGVHLCVHAIRPDHPQAGEAVQGEPVFGHFRHMVACHQEVAAIASVVDLDGLGGRALEHDAGPGDDGVDLADDFWIPGDREHLGADGEVLAFGGAPTDMVLAGLCVRHFLSVRGWHVKRTLVNL